MNSCVLIGIPHVGPLNGFFVDSLISLDTGPGRVTRVENTPIDTARNSIFQTFLSHPEATHVFFMDSDMIFPRDALTRLLSRNVDIVGGTYFSRNDNVWPHVYRYDHDEDGYRMYAPMREEFKDYYLSLPADGPKQNAVVLPDSPNAMQECDAVATGCMLVSRRAIVSIASPWFTCRRGSGGGEDFTFCEKAKAAGFSIWADFSVQCAHEMRAQFVGRHDYAYVEGLGTDHERTEQFLLDTGPVETPAPPAREPMLAGVS